MVDGVPLHDARHRPERTTLYRLLQQHAASFVAHTEASTGAQLPRFVKDEFDAFLQCGILAHVFLRLRCGKCGHDTLLAFSCKRRGFCPSCGVRRMSQTAANLVDHVIPFVPVRPWVLSLPIPLRLLLAAQPELITPVLDVRCSACSSVTCGMRRGLSAAKARRRPVVASRSIMQGRGSGGAGGPRAFMELTAGQLAKAQSK